jgi:hypothetical protein
MDIKKMHEMIEGLVCFAKDEIDQKGICAVDTEEMGKVTDIIKDLAEAQYYRTLVEAMDEAVYGEEYDYEGPYDDGRRGYRGQSRDSMGRFRSRRKRGYEDRIPMYDDDAEWRRDMDMHRGRMYYAENDGMGNVSGGMASSRHQAASMSDGKEGRSGHSRRSYMETKEMNRGNTAEEKQRKLKELENYMSELSGDITEMIADASPEEKNMLKAKLSTLATKIN